MAVRQTANNREAGLCCAFRDLAAIKQRRNACNQRLRQLRQICQRALLDASTLAIALAQQNRRRRFPVRNGVDEHGRQESLFAANRKSATWTQWLPRNINPKSRRDSTFKSKTVKSSV